jgi:hypothetical protein
MSGSTWGSAGVVDLIRPTAQGRLAAAELVPPPAQVVAAQVRAAPVPGALVQAAEVGAAYVSAVALPSADAVWASRLAALVAA